MGLASGSLEIGLNIAQGLVNEHSKKASNQFNLLVLREFKFQNGSEIKVTILLLPVMQKKICQTD